MARGGHHRNSPANPSARSVLTIPTGDTASTPASLPHPPWEPDPVGLWIKRCFRPEALSCVFSWRGAVMITTLSDLTAKKKPEPSAEGIAAVELVRLAKEQGLNERSPSPVHNRVVPG